MKVLMLLAFVLDQQAWSLRVDTESCQVSFNRGRAENKTKLGDSDCSKMALLLKAIEAGAVPPRASLPLIGGYGYKLNVGAKQFELELKSPELCTIKPNGDLECEPQALTPHEELLLLLSPLAERMKSD